jgi:hypothetical protein
MSRKILKIPENIQVYHFGVGSPNDELARHPIEAIT